MCGPTTPSPDDARAYAHARALQTVRTRHALTARTIARRAIEAYEVALAAATPGMDPDRRAEYVVGVACPRTTDQEEPPPRDLPHPTLAADTAALLAFELLWEDRNW